MTIFREISFSSVLQMVLNFLFIVNILFAFLIIFFEKRNPGVTWAWLFVVLLIPYVGFLLYMILGLGGRKHRIFARKAQNDELMIKEITNANIPGLDNFKKEFNKNKILDFLQKDNMENLFDLVNLNYFAGLGFFSKNKEIKTYHLGDDLFSELFNDIKNAKKFIHLQTYIFRKDELGAKVIEALAEKAAEGVEVRLYFDGTGSYSARKKFLEPLIKAGGFVNIFSPPRFIRINFRNHRKICIVDGEIGYLGGFNIGNEYLGLVKKFGFWRDSHIRIIGDATKLLEIRFMSDWNFSSVNQIQVKEDYFPIIPDLENGIPIQVVSSGPDTKWSSVYHGYSKMINEADKCIYIQTPYFVPDENLNKSLKIAVLSGVDVRIMFPANPDHVFVYWASLSYLGELINAGVKCYQYKKGFIHSKVLIIDDYVTSVGTANMDIRSFELNFETNAFIYNKELAEKFVNQFNIDLEDSEEITPRIYRNRSRITKIKEAFSRLISPLL